MTLRALHEHFGIAQRMLSGLVFLGYHEKFRMMIWTKKKLRSGNILLKER